jgi:hypothetical protein
MVGLFIFGGQYLLGDILYDASIEYSKLLNKGYHIILGRKNIQYEINLRFDRDDFFHLVGLQHLTDVTFPTQNRERIFKDILSKKINIGTIRNSVFYKECDVETRITNLYRLEDMLDSSKMLFYINHKEYMKYTRIVADYLCEFVDTAGVYYFFMIKSKYPKVDFEYGGCSFFKKGVTDFRVGTAETKILLNEKIVDIGTNNERIIELYRNSNYEK